MCDDDHEWEWNGHFAPSVPVLPSGLTRRTALKAGLLGGAGITVSGLLPDLARATSAAAAVSSSAGLDGRTAFRTAQHIHARGSEGPASMSSQAAEAAKWVDAMWFTDHDYREAGIGAPRVVHFNSLAGETLGPNPPWQWLRRDIGPLVTGSNGGIESTNVSLDDPDPRGSLMCRAVGDGTAPASVVYHADDSKLRYSMRTPAHGQVWTIDVNLGEATADDGYAFVRVALSYHPAGFGRPDAYYFLEDRFGLFGDRSYAVEELALSNVDGTDKDGDAGTITLRPTEKALVGIVNVPQELGQFVAQTLVFTDDIAAVFPGLIARDNSIRGVWLGTTSRGQPAQANFDFLRMQRLTGQAQFEDRLALTEELTDRFPGLALYNGSEVSYTGSHRHWLGGDIQLSDYHGTERAKGAPGPSASEMVATILAGGGLPVANHPFGTNGPPLSPAAAVVRARTYVADLLRTNANGGLKAIEIFYRSRAGAQLEDHWRLYRLAVRNGLVLTATGVSDNHWGRVNSWKEEANHFITGVYADDVAEESLLDAQSRGRAYSSELTSYSGQLDLSLDDDLMGQIAVRPDPVTRVLTVQATELPKGAAVEVWQIPVDGAGLDGEPGGVIATIPATTFRESKASITVDTTTDAAFATMVVTKKGRRVAGTNPVWHLRSEPTTWSIPEERRATPV